MSEMITELTDAELDAVAAGARNVAAGTRNSVWLKVNANNYAVQKGFAFAKYGGDARVIQTVSQGSSVSIGAIDQRGG